MTEPLLAIENLSVSFGNAKTVVDAISFKIFPGEAFALVGESGSGKSITALSILRLLPSNAILTADSLSFQGNNLLSQTESAFCHLRGKKIGLVFQDPMSSLNPVMTIGEQISEAITQQYPLSQQDLQQRILELLEQVEIPNPQKRLKDFPHQLSGGQRQRIMIAIALAGNPDLLIADEPTTSLDVTIQAQILALIKKLQDKTGMALWLISHDLALVASIADRVAVMQKGKLVETASAAELFTQAKHPYTLKLLSALPDIQHCAQHNSHPQPPLLEVDNYYCYYPIRKGLFKRTVDQVRAVDGVSFSIQKGKTLALVGESGCGKTTLGKSLLNLITGGFGHVKLDGTDLKTVAATDLHQLRAQMQIIFQDPFSSMNPRMLVGDIVGEGIKALYPEVSSIERTEKVIQLLKDVGLSEDSALRYPHEFSGGQRQRICIARALAVKPKLLVCDEPTSALDVSVQAQIIKLLKTLQKEQSISYLFITHDLAVVAEIADDVAVMQRGKIIEQGPVEEVLLNPQHDYTKKLIGAIPRMPIAPA